MARLGRVKITCLVLLIVLAATLFAFLRLRGNGFANDQSRFERMVTRVKAIASRGYSFDPVMANYRDYGFCGVIPKPYRMEDVGCILKEVMGNESASRPAARGRPQAT
jgi:hypothetical protein